MPTYFFRALSFFAISLYVLNTPLCAENSVLVNLLQSAESLVSIKAETGVTYGNKPVPFIHKETGAILVHRKLRPVMHTRHGSGFIAHESGLIVANAHTVQKAGRITILLHDGTSYAAEIIHIEPESDLALLKIDAKKPLTPLSLGDSDTVKLNSRVFTIGGSSLLKNTISEGKINGIGIQKDDRHRQVLRASFNIYEGDSGSPLFDEHAQLLGIMIGAATKRDKICYAIPVNQIRGMLKRFTESANAA